MNSRPSILIIDDDVAFTKIVMAFLQRHYFDVVVSNSPEKGLGKAKKSMPRLILLDIDMPGMSGGEVAKELNEDQNLRQVPIIFLSALFESGAEEGEVLVNEKYYPVIGKPLNETLFLKEVRASLSD